MQGNNFYGTNGSSSIWSFKPGTYTSQNVILTETAINNLILRIPLDQTSVDGAGLKNTAANEAEGDLQNCVRSKVRKCLRNVQDIGKLRHVKSSIRRNHDEDQNAFRLQRERKSRQYTNSSKSDTHYYLIMKGLKHPVNGKLNYHFKQLVGELETMKLPSPSWKIKILVQKKDISGVVFSNKLVDQRCVSFSVKSEYYDIIIDNKPALLLGSPFTVDSVTDLEILLDIVHNIHPKNQMILYK